MNAMPPNTQMMQRNPGITLPAAGAVAHAPIGKLLSALLTGTFRDLPSQFLDITGLLLSAPPTARIYEEKGGTGNSYHTLRFRVPDPATGRSRMVCHYLGKLDPEHATWAGEILEQRRESKNNRSSYLTVDEERIKELKQLRKLLMKQACRIAGKAGYTFKGYRLLKRRTR